MLKIFILFKLRVSNDCVLEVVVSVIRVVNVKVNYVKLYYLMVLKYGIFFEIF